ncbi:sensor histidine kinase [Compostimonas suwonensis]|uniref:histidine kinase n=1 Tax=Compostimonas suwonensis TaxID=1048394 RepID=A0A2M9BWM3_9MICO|nr:ATP-binding protein [Compostimonas suwonensis]PJJ62339.1 PAS domain S-box-containing protein [Compostimonas suwonensis]
MAVARFMEQFDIDSPPPSIKQAPIAIAFAVGLFLTLIPGIGIQDLGWAVSGIALLVIATIASVIVPWERIPHFWGLLIPVVSLLAIGLFRMGTGGFTSIYSALILLPVVWIAAEEGVRFVVFAMLAVVATQALPFLLQPGLLSVDGQIFRAFYTPLVFTLAAGIINDLSHRLRLRVRSAEALRDEKQTLLIESEQRAAALEIQEARLLEEQAFRVSIWNSITGQAVIETDLSGVVRAFNPGAELMLGYTAAEVEGRMSALKLIREGQFEERSLGARTRLALEGNETPSGAQVIDALLEIVDPATLWHYVRRDGSELPVQLRVSPHVDSDGNRVGFILIAIDMTASLEVSRLKDEFIALVSHELRTPLSSILGYLEVLRDELEPLGEQQRRYLDITERNVGRLDRLVGDLLFTSQFAAGTILMDATTVDLVTVLEASVEAALPAANAAGIVLELAVDGEIPAVLGEALRLGQVCDNLISNAIKFTPHGGTVTTGLVLRDGSVELFVSDTGVGISDEDLEQIFTRFFRSAASARNAVQGIGLGLSVTHAIVAAHEGVLGVESEEGVGSTFRVTLPAADARGADAGGAAGAADADGGVEGVEGGGAGGVEGVGADAGAAVRGAGAV